MSLKRLLPGQRQLREAHCPPCPARFGNASSQSVRCLSGCATLQHCLPFAPAMDRGCFHLVQSLESEKPQCWPSPERSYHLLNHYRSWEWLYVFQCASLELPAERCGLDQDPGYARCRDSGSTSWYPALAGSGWSAVFRPVGIDPRRGAAHQGAKRIEICRSGSLGHQVRI